MSKERRKYLAAVIGDLAKAYIGLLVFERISKGGPSNVELLIFNLADWSGFRYIGLVDSTKGVTNDDDCGSLLAGIRINCLHLREIFRERSS